MLDSEQPRIMEVRESGGRSPPRGPRAPGHNPRLTPTSGSHSRESEGAIPRGSRRKKSDHKATTSSLLYNQGLRERLRLCSWARKAAEILLSSRDSNAWREAERLIVAEEKLRPLPGNEDACHKTAAKFFVHLVNAAFRRGKVRRTGPMRPNINPIDVVAHAALALEEDLSKERMAIRVRLPFLEILSENDRLTGQTRRAARCVLEARSAEIAGLGRKEISPKPSDVENDPDWGRANVVAEELGILQGTLSKLVKKGKVRSVRKGRSLIVNRKDAERESKSADSLMGAARRQGGFAEIARRLSGKK